MKKLIIGAVLALLTFSTNVSAEVREIEAQGEYVMEEGESISVARERSQKDALNSANSKIKAYIKGYSKNQDNILTDTVIEMIAVNSFKIQSPPRYEQVEEDGFKIVRCYLTAVIDDISLEDSFKRDQQEIDEAVRKNREYIEISKRNQEKNLQLKKLYKNSSSESERQKILEQINQNDQEFLSIENLARGNQWIYSRRYTEAIENYSKAIELNPKLVEAYNNRGLAYADLVKYDEALKDYNKAIELDQNHSNSYINRGNVYEKLERYFDAIEDYTKATELNPNDLKAYYNRGIVYQALEKYSDSIADYTKAIELNPKLVEAYNNRGLVYQVLERYSEAIADYSKAIELNPSYAMSYNNRGGLYYNQKKYDEAIRDFTKASELDLTDMKAYYNRGLAYQNIGRHDLAVEDFTQAIEIDPNFAGAYYNRSNSYSKLGKIYESSNDYAKATELDSQHKSETVPDDLKVIIQQNKKTHQRKEKSSKAVEEATKMIEKFPKYAKFYNDRGWAYIELDKFDLALADFKKALEIDPKNARAQLGLKIFLLTYETNGLNYEISNADLGTLADSMNAIEPNPDNVSLYNLRARIYRKLGRYDDAIQDYQTVLKFDTATEDVLKAARLGILTTIKECENQITSLIDLGEYDQAIQIGNDFVKIAPDNDTAYYKRGQAYEKLGQFDQAIVDYTKAIQLSPEKFILYNARGIVYQNLGRYDDAMTDFQTALKYTPDDTIGKNWYIDALKMEMSKRDQKNENKKASSYDEVVENCTKDIELNPKNALMYNGRGYAYIHLEKYDEALADFKKVLELEPEDTKNNKLAKNGLSAIFSHYESVALEYVSKATSYKNLKRPDESIEYYKKAVEAYTKVIELNPIDPETYEGRGNSYVQLEKYTEAVADYTKAIFLTNNSLKSNDIKFMLLYNSRGLAYQRLKKYSEAMADFEMALLYSPNDVYTKINIENLQKAMSK